MSTSLPVYLYTGIMSPSHTQYHSVQSYELRADGNAGHSAFLQWFQQAAFEHSASVGWGMDTYAERESVWVMRGIDVEFLQPARYLEEIAVRTWVSDIQRVRSHREYEAYRVSDSTLLARARVDWVFLDTKTFLPRRVPQDIGKVLPPNGTPALAPIQWHTVAEGESLGHFESTRRVYQYELDQMQHVNNTVYLNWIEQQVHDAWRAWSLDVTALNVHRHYIEYRQQAVGDDELWLVSDAARIGHEIIWQHGVYRGETLLIEAKSLGKKDEE